MHRSVLFALLLLPGAGVFGQSTATGNLPAARIPSTDVSGPVWSIDVVNGQTGSQPGKTAAKPALRNFNCRGAKTTVKPAGGSADLDRLFDSSCADLARPTPPLTHFELFARNEDSGVRFPLMVQPHAKGEPIPTQFPSAKVEQIPTQWPNLKMQLVEGGSARPAPAHGSGK